MAYFQSYNHAGLEPRPLRSPVGPRSIQILPVIQALQVKAQESGYKVLIDIIDPMLVPGRLGIVHVLVRGYAGEH
jgi:hypothetical protein